MSIDDIKRRLDECQLLAATLSAHLEDADETSEKLGVAIAALKRQIHYYPSQLAAPEPLPTREGGVG